MEKRKPLIVKASAKNLVQSLKQFVLEVQNGNGPNSNTIQQLHDFEKEVLAVDEEQPSFADQIAYLDAPKLVLEYMNAIKKGNDEYLDNKLLLECYERIRSLLWIATDRSLRFCDRCGSCGIFSSLAKELKSLKQNFKTDLDQRGFFVLQDVSILHNCAKSFNNIKLLEKLNLGSLIKWYSESTRSLQIRKYTRLPTVCTVLLAYIADEDKSDKLLDKSNVEELIIEGLQAALMTEDHYHEGFSAVELGAALRKVSKNRNNSAQVVSHAKYFDIQLNMLQRGTVEEKVVGLELVCQLAFENTNKKAILGNRTLTKLIDELAADNSSKELQNVAKLASFILTDGIGNQSNGITNDSRHIAQNPASLTQTKSLQKKDKLVTISYQRDSDHVVLQLKKRLQLAGYEVRLAVDIIGANITDTTDEMEQSCSVVICVSGNYKDSLYCRAVAEYLYRCGGNDIITLMVEESCHRNGWLNYIMGDEENGKCLDLSQGLNNDIYEKILNFVKENRSVICQCSEDTDCAEVDSNNGMKSSSSSQAVVKNLRDDLDEGEDIEGEELGKPVESPLVSESDETSTLEKEVKGDTDTLQLQPGKPLAPSESFDSDRDISVDLSGKDSAATENPHKKIEPMEGTSGEVKYSEERCSNNKEIMSNFKTKAARFERDLDENNIIAPKTELKSAQRLSDRKLHVLQRKRNSPRRRNTLSGKIISTNRIIRPTNEKHIFISYQHRDQKLVKEINAALKKSGYRTCVDFESTFNDILDFMVSGIEKAAIVLLCISNNYEKSDNCRDEAVFARKLHRRDAIIPLVLEKGYEPFGWLGFLIGAMFYYDVSDGYGEEQHEKIVKQIGDKAKTGLEVSTSFEELTL